ncbi:CDP-glycerol glycerophosphotransferase family protein [Nocardioides sp. BP30]|uniref:bifunctional glycosyltransferase/CDP-glycerol:glycerophosphate glycerophosphotransferase n=1 Tax=Nocardioides sp. BP30 TaxID=3036374 RepID=UPI0024698C12|nr:CDP-glycerol glycerophosphotransferase family protein [Nocardioides sp. BP30]WGL52885.1 CDP-glycerol glycerophosphotransferase family protein [Nocardioides sp. BP30]
MRSRQRVIQALRNAGKASPRSIKGPIGRASRRFRGGFRGPLVTVVLAISDEDTTKIGPMLWDLRNQSHRNLEVRLMPWGRHDAVRAVAAEHADADWRIILSRAVSSDAASARNRGAAAAKGEYLIFPRGGDNVPPHGLARLVRCLEASGSGLAVGRMRTPQTPLPVVDAPFGAAHQVHRTAVTLADAPVAATDLGLGNRMWRRGFWAASGIRFAPRRPSGTDVALASYAAGPFDLMAEDVYIPTDRRDGVAVGSALDILGTLDAWLAEHRATQEQLERLGQPEVTDAWLWGVLDTAIIPFVDDAERATDEQWSKLRDQVGRLLEIAGDPMWQTLQAESKVKLWLVRHDRRAELEQMVVDRLFQRGERRTAVVDGIVVAELPYRGDPEVGVPDDCYLMPDTETPLVVEVRAARWSDPTTIEIDLLAYPDFVGLPEPPQVSVALTSPRGRIDLPVRQYRDRSVDSRLEGRRYQDVSLGTFTVSIDAAELAGRGADPQGLSWTLEVSLATQGLTRVGPVTRIDDRDIADLVGTPHLPLRQVAGAHGTARVGVVGRDASLFAVVARPEYAVRLVAAQVSGRRVTGRLDGRAVRSVRVEMGGISGHADVASDGSFALDVPAPWEGKEHLRWRLVAETAAGQVGIAWTTEEEWTAVGQGAVALGRSHDGGVNVVEAARTVVLDELELVDGAIAVRGRWLGARPTAGAITLSGDRVSPSAVLESGQGQAVSARISTLWDEWRLGERAIPQGYYAFEATVDGGVGHVVYGERLVAVFDQQGVAGGFRHLTSVRSGEPGIWLIRPLGDDERGPFNQGRLQDWVAAEDAEGGPGPIDEHAVYFQSYAGASATDSQLALHEELRRTRPELTIYWGVFDSSSWVPEGGIPVVLFSRDYYRAMATSKYLCMNVDPDRWFEARPGQRMLQTFHGYPAKSMGVRMWRAKGFTERRIQLELGRTSRDWTLILTPAPEMDVYYRTEYRYDGPIHSEGYPRDDAIIDAGAQARREATRERLGIRPGQKVILYAPTWRDDQATNWREAEAVHHLDVAEASRRLGDDYVVLMRGHRFHAAVLKRSEGARLIDVTTYPEINDLIVASDAAVLDYSSLRFDFALTGRPMVFLVPDLADYTGGIRGFLFDYRDTAPGPLLDTADQVIHALGDLDGLAREWAPRIAAFNAKYNYKADGRAAARVVEAFFTD